MAAPRPSLSVAAALVALLTGGTASAQVHWDASAKAGVTDRFETGGDAGAASPRPGPSLELQGHVALLPMIRVGAYLAADLSPAVGRGAAADGPRAFAQTGAHLRVSPPFVPWPWRTWLFAGVGYGYARDLATGLGGGMLDVPVGLGLGRKLTRPWMLFTELGARFGAVGKDAFALSFSVGLSLEE